MKTHRPDPVATPKGIVFGIAIIPKANTPIGDMSRLQQALLNPATARPISAISRTKECIRQLLA